MHRSLLAMFVPACWLATATPAQATPTPPIWSTYFGDATGADVCYVVRRGPGSLVTVIGHSDSPGLATPGAYRTTPAGSADAFVARFDASLPPANQRLWCTYFGGADVDLVFDAEVDGQGNVWFVGVTQSSTMAVPAFPIQNGFQATRKGPSDGFVACISANGTSLLWSSYLGTDYDDRLIEIELAPNDGLIVAGVAEGPGLLNTIGTFGPVHAGSTDGFLARIQPTNPPASQLVWSTYVGGPLNEGTPFSTWLGWGGWNNSWEGNIDVMGLAVDAAGAIAFATPTQSAGLPTSAGCGQPAHSAPGINNVYFVRLAPNGGPTPLYATYFGGSGNAPRAVAPHPAGGFVIGGQGVATNMPVTNGCLQPTQQGGTFGNATDGFLCWIDPVQAGSAQLRYATYFGGNGGEDAVLDLAVESSGLVTIAGYGSNAGNFWLSPGCMQSTLPAFEFFGFVARIWMRGQGADDLVYSTAAGDYYTQLHSVDLDDLGNAWVAGGSGGAAYPTTVHYAWQPALSGAPGVRDGVVTHVPLLPGSAGRFDVPLATPACMAPLYSSTIGAPVAGNLAFALSATNAPPSRPGCVVFGFSAPAGGPLPLPGLGITQLVDIAVLGGVVTSDVLGFATQGIPLPPGTPPDIKPHCQWVFLTNATCPGSGPFGTSERLVFRTF